MDSTIKLEDKANLKITASKALVMEGARIIFLLALLATGNCHLHQLINGLTGLKAGGIGGSLAVASDADRSRSYSGSGSYAQSSSFASANSGSYSFSGSGNSQHLPNGHLGQPVGVAGSVGSGNAGQFGISGTIGIPGVPQTQTSFGGALSLGNNAGHTGAFSGAASGAASGANSGSFGAAGSYAGTHGASNLHHGQSSSAGGSGGVFSAGISSGVNDASQHNSGAYGLSAGTKTDSYGNPIKSDYFESQAPSKPHSFSSQEKIEHGTYMIPNKAQPSNIGGTLTFGSSLGASSSAANSKIDTGVTSFSTPQQPSKLIAGVESKPHYTEPSNVDYYPDKHPNFVASINMGAAGSNAGSSSSAFGGSQSGITGSIGINKSPVTSGTYGSLGGGSGIKETNKVTPGYQVTMTIQNPNSGSYGGSNAYSGSGSYAGATGNINAGHNTYVVTTPKTGSFGYTGGFGGGPGILGDQKPGYAIKETSKVTSAPAYHGSMAVGVSNSYAGSGSYAGATGNINAGHNTYVVTTPKTNTGSFGYTGGFGGGPGILGDQKPGYTIKETSKVTAAPVYHGSMTIQSGGSGSYGGSNSYAGSGSYSGAAGTYNSGQSTYGVTTSKPSAASVVYTGGFGGGQGILGDQKPGYAIKETHKMSPGFQVSMTVPNANSGLYGASGSGAYAGTTGNIYAGQNTYGVTTPKTVSFGYMGGFGGGPGILGDQKPGYAIKETNKVTAAPGYHGSMTIQSGGSGSYGGSNYAGSHTAGTFNSGQNTYGVTTPNSNTTPSKLIVGFGGGPGILGDQKPGYAIKETNKVTPGFQVSMGVQNVNSGSYGGSGAYSGSGSYAGAAGNINTGHNGVITSKPSTASVVYSGGFGGGPGILGDQKPGYGIKVTENKDYGSNTMVTTGTYNHGHGANIFMGSFGGAPGIITATGPATNYPTNKPGSSVILAGGFISSGNTTPKPVGVIGVHGAISTDKKSDQYGLTFGGAPGVITATGPASNYPSGSVSVANFHNNHASQSNAGVGGGSYDGHVKVTSVIKPIDIGLSNSASGANSFSSSGSNAGSGSAVLGHVGHVGSSAPSTDHSVAIDVGGPYGDGNGIYKYEGSHSSSASGSSSSSGSASFSGIGYGGAGHGHGHGHGHGIHGGAGFGHGGGGSNTHNVKGGFMGGIVGGVLDGSSKIKDAILGTSIGGSIGSGSFASSGSGAYSNSGAYEKDFKLTIG